MSLLNVCIPLGSLFSWMMNGPNFKFEDRDELEPKKLHTSYIETKRTKHIGSYVRHPSRLR